MAPVIEVKGVTKHFPGVIANDNVSLTLEEGEIHALLGENGAGKSTLMNIVYGLYRADEGQILVNGQVVHFDSPHDAIHLSIGMVHQHFMLIPVMTVTENIMLGEESTTSSPYISLVAAAILGAGFGWLLGGLTGLIFWLVVIGAYAVLDALKVRPLKSQLAFGALSGLAMGLLLNLIFLSGGTGQVNVPFWPLLGIIIGGLANLRWMDKRSVANRIRALAEEYGLNIDPHAAVRDLPVGIQQRVEIVKALYRDAKILILDEPTAVLTPQEADDLFKVMHRLTERGVSIIFITHKLREVLAIADRITVLRRGQVVGTTTPTEATRESLAQMMVGREVVLQVLKQEAHPAEPVLEVRDLRVEDSRGHSTVDGLSFTVHAGEILGVAGVQGNGQREMVEAITGLRPVKRGQVLFQGDDVTNKRPRVITGLGSSHIPEDRQKHGLVMNYPIADNLILADYYHAPFSQGVVLNEASIEENAQELVQEFDVRTPSIFTAAGKLSGGNQQKVIVARELARKPRLLIAAQPTRGLDVGSIEFIHQQVVEARDAGAAVLLVSAELDEIMSLSDRIVVMYQGHLMADMPVEQATREKLGLLMAGVTTETAFEQG